MARPARIVVGIPLHVTLRGNRRRTVDFGEEDFRACFAFLKEYAQGGLQCPVGSPASGGNRSSMVTPREFASRR